MLKNPFTAVAWDVRNTGAESFLVQERDIKVTADDLQVVTERQPTKRTQRHALRLARGKTREETPCLLRSRCTLGIGAGQMSQLTQPHRRMESR